MDLTSTSLPSPFGAACCCDYLMHNAARVTILYFQQGRISDAEVSIKKLYGKERVAEIMRDLDAAGQGSTELEAGWFDLFSSRYWKGI